jgi:uncharacterized protein (DUF924 family)
LVKEILNDREMFDSYRNYEKLFILMVMMHSEDPNDGLICIKEFETLIELTKDMPEVSSFFSKGNLPYAYNHYDVTKRFRRYPTRNKALGRESTDEEKEYLAKAERWGQ